MGRFIHGSVETESREGTVVSAIVYISWKLLEAGKGYLPNVYHIMLEILQLFSRAEPDGELRSHFHIRPANTNPASQRQVAIGRRQRSQNSTARVRRRSRLRRRP